MNSKTFSRSTDMRAAAKLHLIVLYIYIYI